MGTWVGGTEHQTKFKARGTRRKIYKCEKYTVPNCSKNKLLFHYIAFASALVSISIVQINDTKE